MVDLLATITLALGRSQPLGAVGLNMPHAPKTAMTITPTTMPGRIPRSGRGAPSSDPSGDGCRKAASIRRFAKV